MKRAISSLLNVIVGILLIVGPWYLFKTCGTETKVMKCFWSCRAELALGLALSRWGFWLWRSGTAACSSPAL